MRGRSGLRRKLASRCGMTLSETLAALAVVSILCAAIVIGTNAAASIYRRSVQLSESQTLLSTLSQSLSGELRFAKNIRTDEGTVVYDSEVFGLLCLFLRTAGMESSGWERRTNRMSS